MGKTNTKMRIVDAVSSSGTSGLQLVRSAVVQGDLKDAVMEVAINKNDCFANT